MLPMHLWLSRIGYRPYLSKVGSMADCPQKLSARLDHPPGICRDWKAPRAPDRLQFRRDFRPFRGSSLAETDCVRHYPGLSDSWAGGPRDCIHRWQTGAPLDSRPQPGSAGGMRHQSLPLCLRPVPDRTMAEVGASNRHILTQRRSRGLAPLPDGQGRRGRRGSGDSSGHAIYFGRLRANRPASGPFFENWPEAIATRPEGCLIILPVGTWPECRMSRFPSTQGSGIAPASADTPAFSWTWADYPWTRRAFPTQNCSRRTIFRNFPVPVLGRGSGENSMMRGSLNLPSLVARKASNSLSPSA
jgi:hypothetical protein